jgi:hypothetical protein
MIATIMADQVPRLDVGADFISTVMCDGMTGEA